MFTRGQRLVSKNTGAVWLFESENGTDAKGRDLILVRAGFVVANEELFSLPAVYFKSED